MISLYLSHAPIGDSFYFNHPPLYYQILKVWSWIIPHAEPFYRILGAFFSSLATCGMGLMGRRLFGSRAGIILMLLHSVAPISVAHAQLLLNYSLLELLAVFQIYFYLNFIKTKEKQTALIVVSLLMVLTNYFGLILIFLEWLALRVNKINSEKVVMGFILFIVGLPIALDIIDFKALVWQKIEYQSNNLSFLPTDLFRVFFYISPVSTVIILGLMAHFFYHHFHKYKKFIESFVALLIVAIIFSMYTKRFVFAPRYFVFALPFFLIFLERMINLVAINEKRKILAGACVFLIFSGGIYEYSGYIPVKASNWARAAEIVGSQENVLVVTSIAEYIKYPYFLHLTPGVVRCISIEEFIRVINTHQGGPVWILDIYINFSSYQKELFEVLYKQNYVLTDYSLQSPNTDPIILYKVQKK